MLSTHAALLNENNKNSKSKQENPATGCKLFWFDFFQFLFFKILDTFFLLLEMWGEFWECYHVSSVHTTVYDFCHSFAVWDKLWELSLIAWCDMIDSGLIALAMNHSLRWSLSNSPPVSNEELVYKISKINTLFIRVLIITIVLKMTSKSFFQPAWANKL